MFVSDVFINTHAHVKTCKMAENRLSVVSDTTNVDSDTGSSGGEQAECSQ